MEAMVELKSKGNARGGAQGQGKRSGKSAPPGTSLDSTTGRPAGDTGGNTGGNTGQEDARAESTIDDAVATIGLACQTLAHDAATTPHEFCGWTDTTPLVRVYQRWYQRVR